MGQIATMVLCRGPSEERHKLQTFWLPWTSCSCQDHSKAMLLTPPAVPYRLHLFP